MKNIISVDLHDKVTEAYYGQLGPHFMEKTRDRVHWICRHVDGFKVLDVGCSQGLIPTLLAREGVQVTGVDVSSKAIEEAQEYLKKEPQHVAEKVDFINAEFYSLKLEQEDYTTIIMSEVLEHLTRPALFIEKSAKQLCHSDGTYIITVPFGINDFIDHKHTYYLSELYIELSKWFSNVEYKISESWVGFIAKKPENETIDIQDTFTQSFVNDLERGFLQLETSLRDNIKTNLERYNNLHKRCKIVERRNDEVLSEINALSKTKAILESKIVSRKSEVDTLSTLNKNLANDVENKTSKIDSLSTLNKSLENDVESKTSEIDTLSQELNGALARARMLRRSTSYRLGKALVEAKKSWKATYKLPKTICYLYRDAQMKRIEKQALQVDTTLAKNSETQLKASPEVLVKLSCDPEITFSPINKPLLDIQKQLLQRCKNRKLKVATIMDEFTYNSFLPECDLLQITPLSHLDELEAFRPDIFFIESAWKGKDDLWQTKVSNISAELKSALQWCKDNNVATLMWNKEDPVHFSSFVPLALLVDYVFTTDIDCVPKYKKAVKHERVYVLPFAAQPAVHNPIEIHHRKDKFSFAGSYYLRYPERQTDFDTIMAAASAFKTVDIYDRNHENTHPHYQFPDRYKKFILGSLPFTEIDKAYKGYRYGINMNTIKQSQTMFARRVFELLASNTVVISNFSRGVRNIFGELVICSDNSKQLSQQLEKYCSDDINYEKYRLLGLRKVMSEHTYAHRLEFIKAKVTGTEPITKQSTVSVIGFADNDSDVEKIIASYKQQAYVNKTLTIVLDKAHSQHNENDIKVISRKQLTKKLKGIKDLDGIAIFNAKHFYGEHYLTDLVLAQTYSDKKVLTKGCYYLQNEKQLTLKNSKLKYQEVNNACFSASLVLAGALTRETIDLIVSQKGIGEFETVALAIDPYNFIFSDGKQAFGDEHIKLVSDATITNQGYTSLNELKFAEQCKASFDDRVFDNSLVKLSGEELAKLLPTRRSNCKFAMVGSKLTVLSTQATGKYSYHYLNKHFTREELNLVNNSQFSLLAESTLENAKTVFEFCDSSRKKISHQMNSADSGVFSLAIPNECEYVRFGLRVQGKGVLSIESLNLGKMVEVPAVISGVSNTLVLAKQYPSYDNLYKYGFLHSRVRAYKQHGVNVDVFRFTNDSLQPYREFEGIDVAQGNAELLDRTLASGKYRHVLVHLMDQHMWNVLKKYIDHVKVTVWVHGAEIQGSERRKFEYSNSKDYQRHIKLCEKRLGMWRGILSDPHNNFQIVFVSNTFKMEVQEDLGITIKESMSHVIHNFVDDKIFEYSKKTHQDRLKVLSIRSYSSKKYANDLTTKAIQELSKYDFFEQLEFCLVGDGDMFEECNQPLKKFKNVKLVKRFLTHQEISEVQKDYGVFLNPTRWDSQGVSRDEAMSSGLVTVTNAVSAVPEFVDETCGFLTEAENYVEMAKAIELLYKNPDKYLEMSNLACLRVKQQCSFKETINKEIELIELIELIE